MCCCYSELTVNQVMTLADILLYATLIRFDMIYHPMFRLQCRTIKHDHPNLFSFIRRIHNAGAKKAFSPRDILRSYYYSVPLNSVPRKVPLLPHDPGLE
mmetsp:Transcript_75111/g.176343  ORF Transcript_75111/g.176343 Transcript_75111/m.176343 type:complete len:99 (+) Transcript_75111:452-748(+)